MMLMKKWFLAILLLVGIAFPASAAVMIPQSLEIAISDLKEFDLQAFELEISYNDDWLDFAFLTLTDALGSFDESPGAELLQMECDGRGTVNLAVASNLVDLSGQADDFTLTTLYFWGDEAALHDIISVANVTLLDTLGEPIRFEASFIGSEINIVPVPLPPAIGLLGIGLLSFAGISRKSRK